MKWYSDMERGEPANVRYVKVRALEPTIKLDTIATLLPSFPFTIHRFRACV